MRIQPVTSHPGENALFIVLGLAQSDSVVEKVKDFAGKFSALTRSLSNRYPETKFNAILGFSSNAWDILFPQQAKPQELETFQEIKVQNTQPFQHPGIYSFIFVLIDRLYVMS